MLFEGLTNEQTGLGGGGRGGGEASGGGGGHGGGLFIAPKLGGSNRDMLYHTERDPPMGGADGFFDGRMERCATCCTCSAIRTATAPTGSST